MKLDSFKVAVFWRWHDDEYSHVIEADTTRDLITHVRQQIKNGYLRPRQTLYYTMTSISTMTMTQTPRLYVSTSTPKGVSHAHFYRCSPAQLADLHHNGTSTISQRSSLSQVLCTINEVDLVLAGAEWQSSDTGTDQCRVEVIAVVMRWTVVAIVYMRY